MSTITAKNLNKTYKKQWIIKNINIQIKSKQIIGLLGPNGAGKTTIFHIIAGIIKSNSGNIFINKHNITNFPLHYRSKLGISYLPQESSIFQQMNVFNNLMAIVENQTKINKKKQHERVTQLMNEFNIQHIQYNLGSTLSGGERRRVEIARAIATNPQFILLDEPFSGIDPISIIEIKKIIKKLKKTGIGFFITDHNAREMLDICELIYIVVKGSLITKTAQSPSDILKNKKIKKSYLGENFQL